MWLRAVTYGPFPESKQPSHSTELSRIKSAGFNSIRLFTLPDQAFLNTAHTHGIHVFAGLNWRHYEDFLSKPALYSAASVKLTQWLEKHSHHPAIAGVYVGNEIPANLVRWMSPVNVRKSLESLIALGRDIAPHLLFAYANYPSTEYLEPENADFTAFNIYLEQRQSFSAYLRRLHNIAGDRPLVLSEFGLDSLRSSPQIQADTIEWALQTAYEEETAGFTVYAWSDLWENNGIDIQDWDFGLTKRNGDPKPALHVCANFQPTPLLKTKHSFSIVICTHNSASRITSCLTAISKLNGGPYEAIVVDDGSSDLTAKIVSEKFPSVRLIRISHSGLSTARNIGAENSTGDIIAYTDDDCEPDQDWIIRLDRAFQNPSVSAAGGPNLPPHPRNFSEALVCASPGAPSHVLIDDSKAEHLPGCNIAVRRSAFNQIGGFDPKFKTAGDDVDFCWRMHDANLELAFAPGAFVWHWRRPSIRAFLKQQIGYGKAERLLIAKHPHRFSKQGEALWNGFVYAGGPTTVKSDSIIYHGPMGQAGYQSIANRMLPLRPIEPSYRNPLSETALTVLTFLQSSIRRWIRNRTIKFPPLLTKTNSPLPEATEFSFTNAMYRDQILNHFLSNNWKPGREFDSWDLESENTRILLATEPLSAHHFNHLFRIWGDPTTVNKTLKLISQPNLCAPL